MASGIIVCQFCRKPATTGKPLVVCEVVHPPIVHHEGCRGRFHGENQLRERWALEQEAKAVLG